MMPRRPPAFISELSPEAMTVYVYLDYDLAMEHFRLNQKFSDPIPMVAVTADDHDWRWLAGKSVVCIDGYAKHETVRQMLRDGVSDVHFLDSRGALFQAIQPTNTEKP